jgi:hypothetical protein
VIGQDRLDVTRPDETEPDAKTTRTDGRQKASLLIGAEQDRDARRRLLERLEQGRLRVLVHPVRTLDDRDTRPALDRHEQQLADQILDTPVPGFWSTDDHLTTRPGGAEPVEVGVAAVLDEPARPARSARPLIEWRRAQETGADVERECRLADPIGADEEDGVGCGAPDHRSRRAQRGGLSPGPGTVHDVVCQTGSTGSTAAGVFRVVRRFGAAATSSLAAASSVAAGAAVDLAAAGFRVARGLAGALVAGFSETPSVDPARPVSFPPPVASPSDEDTVEAEEAAVFRGARGLAGALAAEADVDVLRVARGLARAVAVGSPVSTGASAGASTTAAASSVAAGSLERSVAAGSLARAGRPACGF